MWLMSKHSMRRGASGRPRASWRAVRARARALWSDARRSRWRTNSSLAFWVTVACRARLSPRWGTRIDTLRAPELAQELPVHVERRRARRAPAPGGGCRGLGLGVEALEHPAHQLAGRHVLHQVEDEALAAHHPPPAHEEDLDRHLQLVARPSR